MTSDAPCFPIHRVELPPLVGFWALVGPALILMGLSQGSGELWLLPKLHAKHGLDFTWIIFYGTACQIPILVETMRIVALTGESPLVFLSRYSRVASLLCLALTTIAMLGAAGFILTVGESLWHLVGWPVSEAPSVGGSKLWALTSAVLLAVPVLFGRGHVQRYLEIVVGTCSLVSLFLFLAAFVARPSLLYLVPEFLESLVIPRGFSELWNLSPVDLTAVVVGFTYMGLGGWYCLFYPLWGRNRGVGLAAAQPPDEGQDGTSSALSLPIESEENLKRSRRWIRGIWVATTTALAGNAATVLLTSLLAYGLLYGSARQIGTDWDLVTQQAAFFEPTLGWLAPVVFTIAVVAFFLDTWVGTYISLAQLITEAGVGISGRNLAATEPRAFRIVFGVLTVLSLFPLVAPISPGSLLLKWMGILMFCSMPIIGGLLLVINHRLLPALGGRICKPSQWATGALMLTTVLYFVSTMLYIVVMLG